MCKVELSHHREVTIGIQCQPPAADSDPLYDVFLQVRGHTCLPGRCRRQETKRCKNNAYGLLERLLRSRGCEGDLAREAEGETVHLFERCYRPDQVEVVAFDIWSDRVAKMLACALSCQTRPMTS